MTVQRLLELLSVERLCVLQNSLGRCDRDCENCNLVQKDTDILAMYDEVLDIVAFYGDLCKRRHSNYEKEGKK